MLPINNLLVTFDLDGVLMINPFGRGVFPAIQRRLGPYVLPSQDEKQAHAHVHRLIVDRSANLTRQGQWLQAYDWDAITNHVAQSLGSTEAFDVAGLVRSFCRPGYIDKYDDVLDALTWLRNSGVRLAWVTNGYMIYQQPVLDGLGIATFFDDRAAPDIMGKVKPEPEIFWHVRPSAEFTCIHVGDTLIHDVAGARRAGFVSVWIDRELPDHFRSMAPNERPAAAAMDEHLQSRAEKEFCWDAYDLSIPHDIKPDYIIYTLAELREVVDTVDPTPSAVG